MTFEQTIAEIVAIISPVLRADLDAQCYAEGLLDEADFDDSHFEVSSAHTKTGVPFTFWVQGCYTPSEP